MKVTDEMVQRAHAVYWRSDVPSNEPKMRAALEAALYDVPEPVEVTWPKGTVSIPALQLRVSELEAAVQRADAVVETRIAELEDADQAQSARIKELESAIQQLTTERDAALERAERAERDANWALEHANISLPARQR